MAVDTTAFSNSLRGFVDTDVKRGARDTTIYNAQHDRASVRVARVPDGNACDFCRMLGSRGFVYSSEYAAGGDGYRNKKGDDGYHAHCVAGDTVVSGTGLYACLGREYEGELIHISTRSGRNLSITPNHPVLSTRGWINAGSINYGDGLICARFGDGHEIGVPYVNHSYPKIKELFESAHLVNSARFNRMPTTSENLNRKFITDSDIEIINVDCFLRGASDIPRFEPCEHGRFSTAFCGCCKRCIALNSDCAFSFGRIRYFCSANCVMSRFSVLPSLFGCHRCRLNDCSRGTISEIHSGFSKPSGDCPTANSYTRCDMEDAFSTIVGFDDSRWHCNSTASCLDSISLESVVDHRAGDSQSGFDISALSSRDIEVDYVNRVMVDRTFSGHVYNLSTKGGWYLSNGIITHNCNCQVVVGFDTVQNHYYQNGVHVSRGYADDTMVAKTGKDGSTAVRDYSPDDLFEEYLAMGDRFKASSTVATNGAQSAGRPYFDSVADMDGYLESATSIDDLKDRCWQLEGYRKTLSRREWDHLVDLVAQLRRELS